MSAWILFLLPAFASGPDGLVSLNASSASDLAAIAGVDDTVAERVVALRTSRGTLSSVEELRILGLSDAALDALRSNTRADMAVGTASKRSYSSVEEVLANFAAEPSIQEVQAMAMDYTHTHRAQVEAWLAAAHHAAWLPELKLRYTYDKDTDLDYDYLDQTELEYDEGSLDWGQDYRVEVRWKLDELVMSSERIRVISEAQDIVKLRDKVLTEVTRVYFDRRRLQADLLLSPPSDLASKVEDELRLMELTGELDAYTGGRFSDSLAGGSAGR